MTANVSPQALSSLNASTSRSLFSRLTAPLRSRTRNLADFHIRPLEPHRRYSPGDVVKGLVVLTVVKPIRITHLTVALHGFVRVYKNPNGAGETLSTEPGLTVPGSARKTQYFGNGYASLFQDEVILCGEGRLESGVYEFEFDLEFPSKGLPTSIDFERGTISYMIRSTITRPTSIAPTSSCDRKLSLIETVDIGPMAAPKPRIISLEPISRRAKRPTKTRPKSDNIDVENLDSGNLSDSHRPDSPNPEESASQDGSSDPANGPRSPIQSDGQSEISGESVVSGSTGMSFRIAQVPPSASSGRDSQGINANGTRSSKTITATIELLKAGCLPGDSIPLKISIQHTKHIKSMHGIIITLYRQGRIDSAPPLYLFADLNGKEAERLKHEEYYPKSKTGLGGLSLSSAGSTSVFRKDLSQTFAPIIINPSTLSTVVTASIRVPEDVFPTITGVPGQMISFKYHIEVVVDLGGKLANQERHLPSIGMMNHPSNFVNAAGPTVGREDGSGSMLAAWGGGIVDTDQIRREKSVVACLFEIIVGTKDSLRQQRSRGNTFTLGEAIQETVQTPRSQTFTYDSRNEFDDLDSANETRPEEPYPYEVPVLHSYSEIASHHPPQILPHHTPFVPELQEPLQSYVPPPDVPREIDLSEKDRIRIAEQRLLPSQPPQDEAASSLSRTIIPSAPDYIDEEAPRYQSPQHQQFPEISAVEAGPSAPHINDFDPSAGPSAPQLNDIIPGTISSTVIAEEDKQELERRRLMAEASSPADFPDEEDNAGEGSSRAANHPASAPVLADDDEYGANYPGNSMAGPSRQQESLPRYER